MKSIVFFPPASPLCLLPRPRRGRLPGLGFLRPGLAGGDRGPGPDAPGLPRRPQAPGRHRRRLPQGAGRVQQRPVGPQGRLHPARRVAIRRGQRRSDQRVAAVRYGVQAVRQVCHGVRRDAARLPADLHDAADAHGGADAGAGAGHGDAPAHADGGEPRRRRRQRLPGHRQGRPRRRGQGHGAPGHEHPHGTGHQPRRGAHGAHENTQGVQSLSEKTGNIIFIQLRSYRLYGSVELVFDLFHSRFEQGYCADNRLMYSDSRNEAIFAYILINSDHSDRHQLLTLCII